MTTAADLRAEAEHLRERSACTNDPIVLAELRRMIDELERCARKTDNGDARPIGPPAVVLHANERGWVMGAWMDRPRRGTERGRLRMYRAWLAVVRLHTALVTVRPASQS